MALVFIIPFLLISAEFILKFVGLGEPILYDTNLSYRYYPKPNQKIKRFNSNININNFSLRSNEDWDEYSTKKKILFYGDSVTYGGSYLNNRDLFTSIICDKLNNNQKLSTCGNAGVNGYGSENIRNRIIYGDIKNENIMVVTLIGGSGFRSLVNIGSTPTFNEMPTYFPAITEFVYWGLWKVMLKLRRNDWWFEGRFDQNYLVAKNSLKNLRDTLNVISNKKILIILHPNIEQFDKIDNSNKKNLQIKYDLLKEIFLDDKNNFEVINIEDHLDNKDLDNIYYDGVHLNANGHKFFAQIIYKKINQMLVNN